MTSLRRNFLANRGSAWNVTNYTLASGDLYGHPTCTACALTLLCETNYLRFESRGASRGGDDAPADGEEGQKEDPMTTKDDLTDTQKRKLELPKPQICGLCNKREQKSCPSYPKRKHLCHVACDLAEHRTAAVRPTQKSFLTDLALAMFNKKPLPKRRDYKVRPMTTGTRGFAKQRPPALRTYAP